MVIRVLSNNYFVEQTITSENENSLPQYICKNVTSPDDRRYRLIQLPIENVPPDLIRWLADIRKKKSFLELKEYANETGFLVIAVDQGKQNAYSLADAFTSRELSLQERLQITGKLLEKLVLSEMPVYFVENAISMEQILITDAYEISFAFDLSEILNYEKASISKVRKQIQTVLNTIFKKELSKGKFPEMKHFITKIGQNDYKDFLEIYQGYKPILENWINKEVSDLEQFGFKAKLKRFFKTLKKILKPIFYIAAISVAIYYLVISIQKFIAVPEPAEVYNSIGDIQIVDGSICDDETTDVDIEEKSAK